MDDVAYQDGVVQLYDGSISSPTNKSVRSTVIHNDNGNSWIWIENRSSWAIAIGSVDRLSGLTSATFPFTAQPVSLGCYPIDPNRDVVLGFSLKDFQVSTSNFGGNIATGPISSVFPRNIFWKLFDDGAPFVQDLYPLDKCLVLSRRVNGMAFGVPFFIEAVNPGGTGTPQVTLLAGADAPPDSVIMAVAVTHLVLSNAADKASALGVNTILDDRAVIGGSTLGGELNVFGGAANVLSQVDVGNEIVPTGPVLGLAFYNNGTGNVSFKATFYLGVPARFAGGFY